MSMSRRTLSALVVALFATASLSAASVQGSFQRTFQVSGPADLEVLTRSGDITVHSGPAGTVSVNGKIHVGHRWFEGNRQSDVSDLEKNPPIRQSGNSIHIDLGNIELEQVNGAMRDEAGSGDVRVDGVQKGDWDVKTGSGNVQLKLPEQAAFDIGASTGSGRVVVDHPVTMTLQGDVRHEQRAVRGKVRGGGPLVTVHTGSGDVHID